MSLPESLLLPGDNPQAYLPGDRRRALARGETLPLRAHGSALFIDISGFTPLTEALAHELGGRRGAEELTVALDRIFSALLERLHLWRGSVVYFSGDAVTAWLDGDDGTKAAACALEMQTVMSQVGLVRTPAGSEVRLGVKVAVAVGGVRRFVVGDPSVQLIDVLAGRLMDSLAAAEQESSAGEVVLDSGALASLGDRVELEALRDGSHGPVGVLRRLTTSLPDPGPEPPHPTLPDDVVRPWLLPPVWERMRAGRGEFLAELRPAVPVFISFGGLDFDDDEEAPQVLDAFVRQAQHALGAHGGYVLQLTIGDKGAYLYAVHGAPVAHEDDEVRACAAALDLREAAEGMPVTDLRIGIASGRLRSGTYGHHQRRTFVCLGDAVNLAARLMSKARPGEIWVHEDVASSAAGFAWERLEPVALKGKSRPAGVRTLLGRDRRRRAAGQNATALVGRDAELAVLRGLGADAASGAGRVLIVQAEAGTGKSRLVAEVLPDLAEAGFAVLTGEATPLSATTPYAAWREVWSELLGLPSETGGDDAEGAVAEAVAALDRRLVERAPLLGAVLGLALPDNDLTGSFSAQLRKTSLEDLLARLLRLRAARGPVLLLLEDVHWLDDLSRDLLAVLARAASGQRVLIVGTARPDGTPLDEALRGRADVHELFLHDLDSDSAAALAAARHQALLDVPASPEFVATVVSRAEGNPFYLEQLTDYIVAHGAGAGGEVHPDALELPSSLHSLVLSRIDAQPEGPRRAVKVASVVGRTFASPLVSHAYPDLGAEDQVDADLVQVAGTRLIDLEDPAERVFAFGHAVTRDVAYDSLPYSVRTVLHSRVGDALEREPDGPLRHVDLLAFHYSRSENIPQQRRYLRAAATAARRAYANGAAVDYLRRVLPIVEAEERPEILLALADVLEVGGEWAAAEDAVARALEAAADVDDAVAAARGLTARAELARKQGRYAEAEEVLASAEEAFVEAEDLAGRARVLHLRGTLASQQGDTAAARASYEASLALRDGLGDAEGVAAMLTNLALVAEDEGDLDAAEEIGQDALSRRRALADRRDISVSLTNLGMLATARGDLESALERFTEAQTLAEEVGDPWVVAVGRHNLGNLSRDLADPQRAAGHLREALEGYADRDDLWSLAHLFEDAAVCALATGGRHDEEALTLLAAATSVREQIGAPRFPPTQVELDAALEPVAQRLDSDRRAAAERAGAGEAVAAAVVRARTLLDAVAEGP